MRELLRRIEEVERHVLAFEERARGRLTEIHPSYRDSARNLLHYVALRQLDVRDLQRDLSRVGLSSLGRAEGAVLFNLRQVRARLVEALMGDGEADPEGHAEDLANPIDSDGASERLHAHTRALLGAMPRDRHVAIMVTAPSAAEVDRPWVDSLLEAGMDCLRVNGAHEDASAWGSIVDTVRAAAAARDRSCRIHVDLAGPKLRTGPIAPGPRVLKFKPQKDPFGRVLEAAAVPIGRSTETHTDPPALVLTEDDFDKIEVGDELTLQDARARRRTIRISDVQPDRAVGLVERTTYVTEGLPVSLCRRGDTVAQFTVGPVPAESQWIELAVGDPLILTADAALGQPAMRDPKGIVVHAARIACTLPDALDRVTVGERILFDDGKIETVVEGVSLPEITLRVTRAGSGRAKLRAEKGINLPDTALEVRPFEAAVIPDLDFALEHADSVGLSFVRRASDVEPVRARLREGLGMVLKIETRSAFEALPDLLLGAMQHFPVGVMIARGDLAVECGFERLAEVQEEILWICEAAHVPAIWATQVLDGLAQTGIPTRAEVTDASMSVRAECVMLNKGPFIAQAVRTLDDILRRMERHTYKKRSLYRRLSISSALDQPDPAR